jgi:hypothetical protein
MVLVWPLGTAEGAPVPEPATVATETTCTIARSNREQWRRIWVNRPYQETGAGYISANYECVRDEGSPTFSLWYRDQAGIQWRMDQRKEMDANF